MFLSYFEGFVSVSNDGSMKAWEGNGDSYTCFETLPGLHNHEFIYTVASKTIGPDFLFVTGGEDNTAKVGRCRKHSRSHGQEYPSFVDCSLKRMIVGGCFFR